MTPLAIITDEAERLSERSECRAAGAVLLDQAREQRMHEVFLEVRADNDVARALYDSLGFEELGVRPKYYQPDGVDAVVMRLTLAVRSTHEVDPHGITPQTTTSEGTA